MFTLSQMADALTLAALLALLVGYVSIIVSYLVGLGRQDGQPDNGELSALSEDLQIENRPADGRLSLRNVPEE
jgi:hypothetical protein